MTTQSEREHEEAVLQFVERMLAHTQRLIEMTEQSPRFASGVLVRHNERVFLYSAGHSLESEHGWLMETNVQLYPPRMLCLNVENPIFFHNSEEDFGWAEIDVDRLRLSIERDNTIAEIRLELPIYQGPLNGVPTTDHVYCFASWKATEFHEPIQTLLREASYEVYMTLEGEHEGCYLFRPNRPHQGHDYYRGCSGAPIADETGQIVSVVVSGHPGENPEFIRGAKIADYLDQVIS